MTCAVAILQAQFALPRVLLPPSVSLWLSLTPSLSMPTMRKACLLQTALSLCFT